MDLQLSWGPGIGADLLDRADRNVRVRPRGPRLAAAEEARHADRPVRLLAPASRLREIRILLLLVVVVVVRDVLLDVLDDASQPLELLLDQGDVGEHQDGLAGRVLDDALEHQDVRDEGLAAAGGRGVDEVPLAGEQAAGEQARGLPRVDGGDAQGGEVGDEGRRQAVARVLQRQQRVLRCRLRGCRRRLVRGHGAGPRANLASGDAVPAGGGGRADKGDRIPMIILVDIIHDACAAARGLRKALVVAVMASLEGCLRGGVGLGLSAGDVDGRLEAQRLQRLPGRRHVAGRESRPACLCRRLFDEEDARRGRVEC